MKKMPVIATAMVIACIALLYEYLSGVRSVEPAIDAGPRLTGPEKQGMQIPERAEPAKREIVVQIPADKSGGPSSNVPEPVSDSTRNVRDDPEISDEDSLVTADNIAGLFYQDPGKTIELVFDAAREQGYDPDWSGIAASEVEAILANSSVGGFSKERIVECYVTVCIVEFRDSGLSAFDPHPAIEEFTQGEFRRVLWYRHYKDEFSYLFLLLPEFEYRRE